MKSASDIMATCGSLWKTVVWERLNSFGKWCPYSSEVSQLLEQSYIKNLHNVWLGDVDVSLKIYSVNLKELTQVSEITGTKSRVRRHFCEESSAIGKGFLWEWRGDGYNVWHPYDVEVINFIESAYQEGIKFVDLSKTFTSYNYEIDLTKMLQTNKRTRYHRAVKRTSTLPYPVTKCVQNEEDSSTQNTTDGATNASTNSLPDGDTTDNNPIMKQMNKFWNLLKKPLTSDSSDDVSNTPQKNKKKIKHKSKNDSNQLPGIMGNALNGDHAMVSNYAVVSAETNYAIVNGKPWYHHWPPHTPESLIKPVPGIEPLSKNKKAKASKRKGKKNVADAPQNILEQYTEELSTIPESDEEQVCIICYESLTSSSTYSEDNAVVKLVLCSHMFHKACLKAMYESGPKDKYLQCPTCKKIHGEKCGIQPAGEMHYHVLPYSLPSFSECDTIRIIYNIPHGVQGPEHPNPGRGYTARGFPRHCYLPDNEMGRKVLRLLIKAWERRLIFTIGRSSTTGEENTVTWNEIHHKTEFGCNNHEHGFPDPNYFENVLAELEAHGVTDSVYNWYPA